MSTPKRAITISNEWRSALRAAATALEEKDAEFELKVDGITLSVQKNDIQYECSSGHSGVIGGSAFETLVENVQTLKDAGAFSATQGNIGDSVKKHRSVETQCLTDEQVSLGVEAVKEALKNHTAGKNKPGIEIVVGPFKLFLREWV